MVTPTRHRQRPPLCGGWVQSTAAWHSHVGGPDKIAQAKATLRRQKKVGTMTQLGSGSRDKKGRGETDRGSVAVASDGLPFCFPSSFLRAVPPSTLCRHSFQPPLIRLFAGPHHGRDGMKSIEARWAHRPSAVRDACRRLRPNTHTPFQTSPPTA